MPKIFIVLVILAVLVGRIYFWQKGGVPETPSQVPNQTESEANYTNSDWNFTLVIPEGYKVQDNQDLLYVVKEPSPDNETPSPEMRIKVERGNQTTVDDGEGVTLMSEEEVIINGIEGHKTVISYQDYPEGNQCPKYRLHNKGVIFEFSLYECLESDIFETVVQSFKIV